MANSVEIVSNKAAVMAELNKATGKALHTIGLTFVRLAGHEADRLIYDTPLPSQWAKQADLLLATLGAKADYAEKGGTFSVKNLDAIMDEAIGHGGFDFAKPQTKTAEVGSFFGQSKNTAPPAAAGGTNINAGMNAIIRGTSYADD